MIDETLIFLSTYMYPLRRLKNTINGNMKVVIQQVDDNSIM